MTVKEFLSKYNNRTSDTLKKEFVKTILIDDTYIPYETKVTLCKRIVSNTFYKKTDKGEILHFDSTAKYMLFCLVMVDTYTTIDINFKEPLADFNALNKNGFINTILLHIIPDTESSEMQTILKMVEDDVISNEYEIHAFIKNEVERFGVLFGTSTAPVLEKLAENINNIDENKMIGIMNKVKAFLS